MVLEFIIGHWRDYAWDPFVVEVKRVLSIFLVFFLPLYWLFILSIVAWFSAGWSLTVGAFLWTYPHLLWESRPQKALKRWPLVVDIFSIFASKVFEYFPIRLHRCAAAEWAVFSAERQYLFGYHPHGCESFGLFALCFPALSGWTSRFPNLRTSVVGVANSLLCVPILGTIFGWLGFIPASRAALEASVAAGHNVCLVPGGVAEMLEIGHPHSPHLPPHEEVVFLSSRRGFIRFALHHGLQLVPVYGFGENRTFRRYSALKRLRMYLSRKLGITIQAYRGRWFTLMPFAYPIDVVVGAPLEVEARANPTDVEVEELLRRYIEALRTLFEANKHLYGYGSARLVVL